jgi:hypothetical protein
MTGYVRMMTEKKYCGNWSRSILRKYLRKTARNPTQDSRFVRPRFEPVSFQIQSRIYNHYTWTFCIVLCSWKGDASPPIMSYFVQKPRIIYESFDKFLISEACCHRPFCDTQINELRMTKYIYTRNKPIEFKIVTLLYGLINDVRYFRMQNSSRIKGRS